MRPGKYGPSVKTGYPRMDRPIIAIPEPVWRRKSLSERVRIKNYYQRRGYRVWVQRTITKNPYWHNSSTNLAQIKFIWPDGDHEIYTLNAYQKIQFPKGTYYVQVRYKENSHWTPWASPSEPYEQVQPGTIPKRARGQVAPVSKAIKVKKFKKIKKQEAAARKAKKKKKKRTKKKKAKARKKKKVKTGSPRRKAGRERPPKKWFNKAIRAIKKYRPKVKSPRKLAGWIWYHGMKKTTKASILAAAKKAG